jgi:hypothetical protein
VPLVTGFCLLFPCSLSCSHSQTWSWGRAPDAAVGNNRLLYN